MRVQQEGLFAVGLRTYVRAVARALQVEPEAAWCEVAEMSTAYVAVGERSLDYPDRDVMLLWDERIGWLVALEARPDEEPVVLAHINAGVVPGPAEVAAAVASALTDRTVLPGRGSAHRVDPGHVRAEILAYALPAVVGQAVQFPRPA